MTILSEPGAQKAELLIPLYFAPLWGPSVWIFVRLLSEGKELVIKKSLALAIGWGVLFFILSAAVFVLMVSSSGLSKNEWEAELVFGTIALLQLALILASIKAYYSLSHGAGDWHLLLWPVGMAVGILSVFLLSTPFLHLEPAATSEASAVGSLRTINTAQMIFAEGHRDRGFAPSLRDLGSSPGAELIDDTLASGKKSGYVITMIPAAPDSHGRITKYILVARPEHFGKGGTRNFFTDESGAIHSTSENRPPTAQDPLL